MQLPAKCHQQDSPLVLCICCGCVYAVSASNRKFRRELGGKVTHDVVQAGN